MKGGNYRQFFSETVNAFQKDAEDDLFNELCNCFANLTIPWCEIRTRPSKLRVQVRYCQIIKKKRQVVATKSEDVTTRREKRRHKRCCEIEIAFTAFSVHAVFTSATFFASSIETRERGRLWGGDGCRNCAVGKEIRETTRMD